MTPLTPNTHANKVNEDQLQPHEEAPRGLARAWSGSGVDEEADGSEEADFHPRPGLPSPSRLEGKENFPKLWK